MIRIAVDAVGGDHGPAVIVEGALAAAREIPLALTLVGPGEVLRPLLSAAPDAGTLDVRLVESGDAVGMGESPTAALRRRPKASIRVAVEEVRSGRAAALFSAGNTGATVVAAYTAFGMLEGVDRPALAAEFPTRRRPAILLDVGANVDCRPQHLVQFALMGSAYARLALDVPRPRVALLSVGEEETKGNDLTRETHRLLKASGLHFTGNIEARELYAGKADVVVCDGFTGNIVLKLGEGLAEVVGEVLREAWGDGANERVLGSQAYQAFNRRVDYSEHGGAPLLGVAGLVVIGHGRSSAKAVRNGVARAAQYAQAELIARVTQDLIATGERHR
jgi:glycerol-3-phosphate acyltransferase PlsX